MKIVTPLLIAILSISITACGHTNGTAIPAANNGLLIDSLPGSCANLTKNADGNVVLSWVRQANDSSAVFCYAVSPDGGKSFNEAVVIPASNNIMPHAENIPKVIFKPSGEILAVWGAASTSKKNKYSGSVYYAQSFDQGKTWSSARPLVTDTAGFDQRYFDLSLLPNGEVGIIWLDNRKTIAQEGSALFYATTKGKQGFTNEKKISQPCCPCCRTDLHVDAEGNIHVLYRGIVQDSIRDMVHTVSTDGGQTFSAPERISKDNWVINACPHTGPAMTETGEGLHFAWYTGGESKGTFYTSLGADGNRFRQNDLITTAGKHAQLTADSNGGLFIVWDEPVKTNSTTYSRIGMQIRPENGKNVKQWFITPDTVNASYPVVVMAKDNRPLVAYSQKKGSKNYVAFQRIP